MAMIGDDGSDQYRPSESFDSDLRYRAMVRHHLVDTAPQELLEAEWRIDHIAPTSTDRAVFASGAAVTVTWTLLLVWVVIG